MPVDRRHRTASERESYTNLQQRKRLRQTRPEEDNTIHLHHSSLLPSSSDDIEQSSPKGNPWKGWKTVSSQSSPETNKENTKEFPPLNSGNIFDSWYTPEPIKNWADFMDEEETNKKQLNLNKKQRFKRKLLLSDKSDNKPDHKSSEHKPILTDEHRLAQRQKQIDFGKNTAAYGRYITDKPRHCRDVQDPKTPDKFQICSTRSWTGQVKCWRRRLHEWDPPSDGKENIFDLVSNSNALDEDININVKNEEDMETSTTSLQNSCDDFFKDLNIDNNVWLEDLV